MRSHSLRSLRLGTDDWMLIALVVALVLGCGQWFDWMHPVSAHAVVPMPTVVEVSGSLG